MEDASQPDIYNISWVKADKFDPSKLTINSTHTDGYERGKTAVPVFSGCSEKRPRDNRTAQARSVRHLQRSAERRVLWRQNESRNQQVRVTARSPVRQRSSRRTLQALRKSCRKGARTHGCHRDFSCQRHGNVLHPLHESHPFERRQDVFFGVHDGGTDRHLRLQKMHRSTCARVVHPEEVAHRGQDTSADLTDVRPQRDKRFSVGVQRLNF